jgi:two-component system chemotaxis response regulator CheY
MKNVSVVTADDSLPVRQLIKRTLLNSKLTDVEFEVEEAKDGVEALQLCRLLRPDLLFLNIHMPNMDGYQALKEIRSFNKEMYVLMVTSDASPDMVKKIIQAGVNGYVVKPFKPELIMSEVEKFLSR